MSLINCSDCNQEVSSEAVSCPKCGRPIVGTPEAKAAENLRINQAAEEALVAESRIRFAAIEAASKKAKEAKKHFQIGLGLAVAGFVMVGSSFNSAIGGLFLVAGVILMIAVANVKVWSKWLLAGIVLIIIGSFGTRESIPRKSASEKSTPRKSASEKSTPSKPSRPSDCNVTETHVSHSVLYGVEVLLNNPDSFDFIKSKKIGKSSYMIFFRAENAFGATIIGSATAHVDKDCNPIRVEFH